MTGHVAQISRPQIEHDVAELRAALDVDRAARGVRREPSASTAPGPDGAKSPEDLLRRLHRLLIAPLDHALPRDGALLALEPHGALWLLPFAALIAEDGQCLADRAALLYAPSAALLEKVRSEDVPSRKKVRNALIIANPIPAAVRPNDNDRFRFGFDPLPGAEKEAEIVYRFFSPSNHTLLLGKSADLATVVTNAPHYSIFHLATHGITRADDPLESFVLLAPSSCGDRLSARRVLTLPLRADLVTLSACQTGLGKIVGDGLIGLSRAFLIAGARSVLVSQWSIDDDATITVMQAFYRLYLVEGSTKPTPCGLRCGNSAPTLAIHTRATGLHLRWWARNSKRGCVSFTLSSHAGRVKS